MSVSDSGNEVLRKSAEVLDGGSQNHDDKGSEYYLRVADLGKSFLATVEWDSWTITNNLTTDLVTWYNGGITGDAVLTFTATYETARKKKVISGAFVKL